MAKYRKLKLLGIDTPAYRAAVREYVHGAFVRQGMMAAFPLSFPDVTIPIPAAASRITALAADADGVIYGGTSGERTHLFAGMFHGATGMVYDLGIVPAANHCAAVACGGGMIVAGVNGPGGGRLVQREMEPLPFDLIQEWYIERKPLREIGPTPGRAPLVDLAFVPGAGGCVGVTTRHVFLHDIARRKSSILAETACSGRLITMPSGAVYGWDDNATMWRLDPRTLRLRRRAVRLPPDFKQAASVVHAGADSRGGAYLADEQGRLFPFSEKSGIGKPVARTPLTPVGPMAATADGRLFGFCGAGIARLFCFDPRSGRMDDLGCAVSVIQRRRYGFEFGAAAAGRDGMIIFGENDNGGHLWLYFPAIGKG